MNENSNTDVDSVSRGEVFPAEFMDIIQETASTALEDYLRAHKAPDPVIDALRDLVFLQYLRVSDPDKWHPDGRKGWNEEVKETVSRMTWEVRLLGGVFHGPDNMGHRHPAVVWEKCDESPKRE